METTAVTVLDIQLDDPETEADFMRWWDEARELLSSRARLSTQRLYTLRRGHYFAELGFPLPGVWKVVSHDRRWQELERQRPAARVQELQGRRWHRDGVLRDLTTRELATWTGERAAGTRDFVLIDTLAREHFMEGHLPGAVNLPLDQIDMDSAARVIGPDPNRSVVVYCSSYG